MRITTSIILYLVITFSVLQNWLVLACLSLLVFSFMNGAGYLIFLAILIDGYFGNFYNVPYLSLLAVWWYMLIFYLRPKVVNLKFINK